MNKLKYSIIYGVIRPEISEQLSLGLIIVDGDKVKVRYSIEKLNALQGLYTKSEYDFVHRVMKSISSSNVIQSTDAINYLSRYSNNLIAVSSLQDIDLDSSQESQDWLYRNYVYAGA
ncbi:MAG: hypothetical protein IKK67_11150 [Bacteroidaceae bacterium]|nr:hypothetical protein [Bacteroidaceae bacterium]